MVKCVIWLLLALAITIVSSVPISVPSNSSSEIECKALCEKSIDYAPLCGKDGRTYPNKQALNCKNNCAKKLDKPETEIAHDGKCPTDRPKTVPRV